MKNKLKKISFCSVLISLLLLLTISSSEVNSLPVEDIFNSDFDTEVANRMEGAHIPSCAIGVINDTEVVFEKGYGDQLELNTVYPLASLNKPLAAVAILHLYDEGIIDLDEDINTYLHYIIRNPYYPDTPITCKMLLSMCATINDRNSLVYADIVFNHTTAYPDYICELLNENGSLYSADIWNNLLPGSSFAYSTLSFDILVHILQLQTSKTYEQYLKENFLTPLGMTNTKGNWSDYNPTQCAIPHAWNHDTSQLEQLDFIQLNHPQDFKTTVQDFSHFVIMLINKGIYGSERILEEATVNLMLQEQRNGYGLGLYVNLDFQSIGKSGFKGHYGFGPGFVVNFAFKITNKIGTIFFSNQCDKEFESLPSIMQFYQYVVNESLRLLEENGTEENSFAFLTLNLGIVFLGILIFRRRRK